MGTTTLQNARRDAKKKFLLSKTCSKNGSRTKDAKSMVLKSFEAYLLQAILGRNERRQQQEKSAKT